MNDPQIAAALRASSPDALAELLDAYGDNLFRYCWSMLRNREIAQVALRDTLVVAQAHIARLADPESLGPWLYSLARAECRRRRAVPAAQADEVPVRPSQRDADSRLMAWNAVMSMAADEFEALDLVCRHDVDVALVLGLPAEEAQDLLDRSRHSLEQALGAEILASRGHACPDRAEVLAGWTGTMTAPVRERVLEHAAGCEVCGPKLPRNVSAARVFALLPAPALSPLAQAEVLDFFDDHQPRRGRRGPRAGVLIAAAGAISSAAVIASAFVLVGSGGQPAAVRAIMPAMAAGSPTGPAPERPSGLGTAGAVQPPVRPGTGRAQSLPPRLSPSPPLASTSDGRSQAMITSVTQRLPPAKAPATQQNTPQEPAAPGGGGTPASPGTLQVSTDSVAVGTGSTGQLTLTATGGPVNWSATSSAPAQVSLSSNSGTLQAGQSVTLTVTVTHGPDGGSAVISLEPPASAPQIVQVSWTALPSSPGRPHRQWHRRPQGYGPASEPTSASMDGPGQQGRRP